MTPAVRCSFCTRKNEPLYQIASDDMRSVICDECIDAVANIAQEEYGRAGASPSGHPINTPVPISVVRQNVANEKERLGKEQGWSCCYCRMKGSERCGPDNRPWHVDHLYPVVRGGDNKPDNLVLACATCNLKKKAKLLAEFLQEPHQQCGAGGTA